MYTVLVKLKSNYHFYTSLSNITTANHFIIQAYFGKLYLYETQRIQAPGPVFCLLLGVIYDYHQPMTGEGIISLRSELAFKVR